MLTMLSLLLGCPGFGNQAAPDCDLDAPPTWDDDVEELLTTRCAICHTDPPIANAPAGFVLNAYDDGTSENDGRDLNGAHTQSLRILARAVEGNPSFMPPNTSGPGAEEQAILECWVEAGAPRSAADVEE